MVARSKIDSNETNLYYAEEESLGVLPVNPVWHGQEPNSYSDFGGQLTLLARNPINSSRQRKKGEVTDLDASGGYQQDFTLKNMPDILQGFMFADFRRKAEETPTGVEAGAFDVASNAGFAVGSIIYSEGFTTPANNGVHIVTGVGAGKISAAGLVAEATATGHVVLVGFVGAAGDIDIAAPGGGVYPAYTSTVFDFTTLGLTPGEWIFVGGDAPGTAFVADANNGFKRVHSVTAHRLEIDISGGDMVTVADVASTIQFYIPRSLKNETGDLIKRRSYQLERQLGKPDTASNNVQSEYLIGAVPSTLKVNVAQADKLTCDMTFVAMDDEQRTATVGLKSGARANVIEADAFNTSSDFSALRLSIVTPGVATPAALFAYLQKLDFTLDNSLTVNKAVAVLGGFDVTAGTFKVSATATAYFATIEAVQAVRNNANAQMYVALAKHNAGFVFDMPLIALGDARLDVSLDNPITLPLSMDAATAALINPATDYTCMWCFFDYLPTLAE